MIALTATEEKRLLEQMQLGDQRAFERLYRCYDRELFYSILRLVRLQEVAAEIHQDVFLVVWTKRAEIDVSRPLLAFMRQVAKNRAINFFHKASRDKNIVEQLARTMTELHDPVNDAIAAKEASAALEAAISRLPSQRQQVFRLIKLENKTYEFAAQHFGVSVGTIKDHMAKATKFLKNEISVGSVDLAAFLFVTVLLSR